MSKAKPLKPSFTGDATMRKYLKMLLMTALCLNPAVAVMARSDRGGGSRGGSSSGPSCGSPGGRCDPSKGCDPTDGLGGPSCSSDGRRDPCGSNIGSDNGSCSKDSRGSNIGSGNSCRDQAISVGISCGAAALASGQCLKDAYQCVVKGDLKACIEQAPLSCGPQALKEIQGARIQCHRDLSSFLGGPCAPDGRIGGNAGSRIGEGRIDRYLLR